MLRHAPARDRGKWLRLRGFFLSKWARSSPRVSDFHGSDSFLQFYEETHRNHDRRYVHDSRLPVTHGSKSHPTGTRTHARAHIGTHANGCAVHACTHALSRPDTDRRVHVRAGAERAPRPVLMAAPQPGRPYRPR